jgi:HK97 family phage major capsid protein
MPVLEKDDIQSWDKSRVEKELRGRRDDVAALREKNGGTLVGIKGDDADTVREHMQSLNLLGERFDELREQEAADGTITKLTEFLDQPASGHPGHLNGNGKVKQQARDIGALFTESDAWKAFKDSGKKDIVATLPLDAVFGSGYKGIGEVPRLQAAIFPSSNFPIQPDFRATPYEVLFQQNNIGPLMPQGTTTSNTVRYVIETVTSSGATAVAEGATKPEANISFASTDEPVRKIAVTLPIDDEALDDVDFLRSYLNARLRLFVQNEEDRELLVGSGTAPEIKGIMNRSGINTATSYSIGGANPDQALVDAVFHAAMRVRDSFLEPDAAVMKPATWEIAALAKDGNRNYLLGGPGGAGFAGDNPTPRLWGLRIVLNTNMPAQTATNKDVLVGAFAAGAMVVRKGGIDLAVSDSHSTFFQENKLMLRAEERLALCVWRPAAFATVTSAA